MRLLLGLLFTFFIAVVVGLGSTWLALSRGTSFGAISIGAWKAWPRTGTADVDPYARAAIARNGELPTGSGDGVAFFATSDDIDRPLDGRCDVLLKGLTPQARFWTLTLYTPEGQLIANSIDRQGFTSQEIIRLYDGSFEIAVAPRARTGNWLPTGGIERYVLVLRLYDTPIGIATRGSREVSMPKITQGRCP